MRFQVSQVLDAIEQRLTTDFTGAQAVVDLGGVITNSDLDRGRPASLVRIGMVIDALGRYLVDGGAMLYGVVARDLLSEQSLTSKERMVLGRWTDDGLIEATPAVGDRVVEIADLTGLPLITTRAYPDLAQRFGWLAEGGGRVLLLTHRTGVAALRPMDNATVAPTEPGAEPGEAPEPAVGRARVTGRADESGTGTGGGDDGGNSAGNPDGGEPVAKDAAGEEPAAAGTDPAAEDPDVQVDPERDDPEPEAAGGAEHEEAADEEAADEEAADEEAAGGLPLPVQAFSDRGAARVARTRISWRRFRRAEPSSRHAALLRRQWRCDGFECPAFGEHRRIGQPVPRLRGEVPICPRHDQPVTDAGPRPPAYPVSIVVDDLPRQRLVVRGGEPVQVGRGDGTSSPIDRPEVVSVAPWLHRAAAAWVSPVHVRLEATGDGLVVTDLSENGAVVWQRKGPDDPGTARPLRQDAYPLGEWDSVELYTGIELVPGNRRLTAVLGRDELESVLVDAPTAAHHQVGAGSAATAGG